jgi:hypothetical protein
MIIQIYFISKMSKMFKSILLIFLLGLMYCNEVPENTCTGGAGSETCTGRAAQAKPKKVEKPTLVKPKIEYPGTLEHEDLFKKKGHEYMEYVNSFSDGRNFTEYYDFSLADDELESLKFHRMSIYPQKKFEYNTQGNFLHFYKIAYEKGLPVYFTTDAMLYALTENVNFMLKLFYEELFIHAIRKFLDTVIEYAEKLKDTTEGNYHRLIISYAQIFYGTAIDFLVEGFETYKPNEDIAIAIKNNVDLAKKYTANEFFIMMKKKMVDTNLLIPPTQFRRTNKLSNIYRAIRWFQVVKFDLHEDLNSIWLLGKLINDSGSKPMYKNIYHMLSYIWGQDRESPNVLEVYEIGKELGFDEIQLNPDQLNQLYRKILLENLKFRPDLGFSSDYIVYTKEALEFMRLMKTHSSFVFTTQYNIEDWVLNKLVDYRKDKNRHMVHPYEVTMAIHQSTIFKQFIFNRYMGKKTWEKEELLPLRDDIDIRENFEKAKYTIKDSMKKDPESWRNNMMNHFHLLLFKATRRIKINDDPLFKTPQYKEKVFNTAYASHVHFKQDIDIMTRVISGGNDKVGGFPEVAVEPNYEFYNELYLFFSVFKENLSQFLLSTEDYLKVNHKFIRALYKTHIDDMMYAIRLLQKLAPLQEKGKLTDEQKSDMKELVFYNGDAKIWDGWYFRLFNKGGEKEKYHLSYNIYITRVHTAMPLDRFSFSGALIYTGMKFPDIGVLIKQDENEKKEKLFLYASYSGFDFIKRFSEKVSFEDISDKVMKREY